MIHREAGACLHVDFNNISPSPERPFVSPRCIFLNPCVFDSVISLPIQPDGVVLRMGILTRSTNLLLKGDCYEIRCAHRPIITTAPADGGGGTSQTLCRRGLR